ncbi:sensor histidine kinase [Paenibacillus sp. HB172176]|uniref:sensor histidine kinase n=1 Tax=Paenibacillus sp. HB172176 TaxID=2493690 RepID=UPI00143A0192|nr:sensor histidine kinase [Paenibacillus sp. HB172176]
MSTWHFRYSIQTKILAFALSLSFISIILMAAFTSYYYTKSAKHDFYTIAQDSTERMNHQLDRYFNQLAQSTYASVAGPLPTNPLLGDNPESGLIQAWLKAGGAFSREQEALVESILTRYIAINYSNILGIVLQSLDHRLVYSQYNALNVRTYLDPPWTKQEISHQLSIVPTFVNTEKMKVAGYPFITLIVPIYDPNTVKLLGNLNIALSVTEIQSILGQSRLGKTGYFFIADEAGNIIYHPNVELVGKSLRDTELSGLDLTKSNDTLEQKGKPMLVSSNRSEIMGWHTVAIVPMEEMASGLTVARNSILLIMSGIILISVLFIPRLVRRLTRPIVQLKNSMSRVERGDLSVRLNVIQGNDEIQQLNGSFNRMTAQLDELIHTVHDLQIKEMQLQLRQKEAQIQALQNQINPHLLYNTLEIIKSIAFIQKVPIIEKMATNLASVYRYTTKIPGSEVELRDELITLKSYLEIIHIRFGKHFQSRIVVDDKYLDCRIIKLSLQPIVENSVKYAVEPKNGKASIIVNAFEEDNDLKIEIADNGNGFPEDVLQHIQEKLRFVEDQPDLFASEESVGIINVHARLMLNYGSSYGLSVVSFPGRGSVVTIKVPKRINESSEIRTNDS